MLKDLATYISINHHKSVRMILQFILRKLEELPTRREGIFVMEARRPSADFLEKVKKDINPVMRAILNDWLVEVAVTYKIIATSFNQILFFGFCSGATCALVLLSVFCIINRVQAYY